MQVYSRVFKKGTLIHFYGSVWQGFTECRPSISSPLHCTITHHYASVHWGFHTVYWYNSPLCQCALGFSYSVSTLSTSVCTSSSWCVCVPGGAPTGQPHARLSGLVELSVAWQCSQTWECTVFVSVPG